jgi:CDP-2,3-bis-(O-geranylgeranyl)-sn-glycerol synthase
MVLESPWFWTEFIFAWWILFPAYAANCFPPLARGSRPLDRGLNWKDGRRILGDGKTIEGTILGIVACLAVGGVEYVAMPYLNSFASQWSVALPQMNVLIAFVIALGVMAGDMVGSFAKRRIGLERGVSLPVVDQIGFVIGVIVFAMWFISITPYMTALMLLMTLFIHRISNVAAHRLRIKHVPW